MLAFPLLYVLVARKAVFNCYVQSKLFFCFGSVSLFFMELFLHSSPVAYWAPSNLGSSSFSVIFFCLFILFMGFQARILKWFAIPFPSGPWFVRNFHHDPSILGGPTSQIYHMSTQCKILFLAIISQLAAPCLHAQTHTHINTEASTHD